MAYTKVEHSLEPGVTYRSDRGNLFTVMIIDDNNNEVTYAMHPDEFYNCLEIFSQPIYIFLEWIRKDKLRQISSAQNMSTNDIVAKWDSISKEKVRGYLWESM